jgi:pyruvyl transferase EpsO
MNNNNIEVMDILKSQLSEILTVLPKGSQIYFIDYPVYDNVGDLLILKGTEEFFKKNNIKIVKRFSWLNFNKGTKIPTNCTIVCQGGGNFGDLYVPHREIRNYLVTNYPKNKIIILPQSIYYENNDNLARDAAIFKQHKQLHLFVRDENSYKLAKDTFSKNVYLSPDMAHQLWPLDSVSVSDSSKDTLNFIRTDKESKHSNMESCEFRDNLLDWPTLLSKYDHKIINLFILLSRVDKKLGNILPVYPLWDNYTNYIISKSIKVFRKYKTINTSRLHGHILACLLGKNNILIDNSYGKNSSYYKCWTIKDHKSILKELDK